MSRLTTVTSLCLPCIPSLTVTLHVLLPAPLRPRRPRASLEWNRRHTEFLFSYLEHVMLLTLLRICPGWLTFCSPSLPFFGRLRHTSQERGSELVPYPPRSHTNTNHSKNTVRFVRYTTCAPLTQEIPRVLVLEGLKSLGRSDDAHLLYGVSLLALEMSRTS